MTIEKAIELLRLDLGDPGCIAIEDLTEAQSLAIEALARLEALRFRGFEDIRTLLPGETLENTRSKPHA